MISHLLLTYLATTQSGIQADMDKTRTKLRLLSIPQMQQVLRQRLWDDVVNGLENGSRNRRVGKKMKQLILL